MSTLTQGHLFVELAGEHVLNVPAMYEQARERAQREVRKTGGELLTGPAQLIVFHPLTRMPPMLIFPMGHEVSVR